VEWLTAWLKRAFGVKIFLAIWILVLLVPAWRSDVRYQWNAKRPSFDKPSHNLTATEISLLKSRFPDDYQLSLEQLRWDFGVGAMIPADSEEEARKARLFGGYAALSRRFPRENEIRKAWLRDATIGPLEIEPPSTYDALPPRQRPQKSTNWLSNAQLQAAITVAREGAAIEPQNSFFPWMESVFQFALKRPNPALRAIERAAMCRDFDDGTLQTTRRRIEISSRAHLVGWRDKLSEWAYQLLPHLGKIRASAGAAMEISLQKHRRGDAVGALQVAAVVARAGEGVSRAKSSSITVLVGDDIQQIAWNESLKNIGRDVAEPRVGNDNGDFANRNRLVAYRQREAEIARRIAIYARQLKQELIAQQALSSLPALKGQRLGAFNADSEFDNGFQGVGQLSQIFWLQGRLLGLSLTAALVWSAAFVLSLGCPVAPEIRRALAGWAAFCIGATAAMLGVALVFSGVSLPEDFWFFFNEDQPDLSYARDYANNLNTFLTLLWLLPIALTALFSRATISRLLKQKLAFTAKSLAKTLIYSVMMGSAAATFSMSLLGLDYFPSQIWDELPLPFIGSILAAGGFHVLTTQGKSRFAALLFWSVPWILLGAALARESSYDAIWTRLMVVLALVFLGLSAYLTSWRPAPTAREFLADLMSRARVLAATLAVASAISYLAVKIVVLPAEARMSALIDRQLQIGEVAFVEERLAETAK